MEILDKWKVLFFAFRLGCSVVTVFMVGYWIYKFQKNEDVSTIEYQYVNASSDLRLPELTICLGRQTLADSDMNLDGFIDFRDYVQQVQTEKTQQDSVNEQNDYETTNTCIDLRWNNNFNGFWNAYFCRCYGLEIDSKVSNIEKQIQITFRPELSSLLLNLKSITVFAVFNYPQQLLRNLEDIHMIWDSKTKITSSFTRFKINAVEVIIRRNRQNLPCFTGWKNLDNSVFEKHREEAICTAHYQVQNKPLCNTTEEILNSTYSMKELRNKYFPPPCHEMSAIASSMNIIKQSNVSSPVLYISYPEKIKVITQIKSVDAHMLLGNIGGYIGLFLGNIFKIYLIVIEVNIS